jgi:hypothetical protein
LEKGFNTDIQYSGRKYHIQTEDWGKENPFLVTRIFREGAVVKSMRTSYTEIFLKASFFDPLAIRRAMEDQHKRILDWLVSGQKEV